MRDINSDLYIVMNFSRVLEKLNLDDDDPMFITKLMRYWNNF